MVRFFLFFATVLALSACGSSKTDTAFISVETQGNVEGPDLVLIPGLSSSSEIWDSAVKQFGPSHHIHLISIRGFAETPAPDAPVPTHILEVFAAQIIDYLQTEVPNKAVIMGHSMGGYTALAVGSAAPEEIAHVIIVDSLPFVAGFLHPNAPPDTVDHFAQALQDVFLAHTPDTYRAQQELFLTPGFEDKPYTRDLMEASLLSDEKVVAQGYHDLLAGDGRRFMADLEVPVTVLLAAGAGREAAKRSQYERQFAAATVPVTLIPIAPSGHHIMYDQPERYLAELTKVLTPQHAAPEDIK